jgi:uncharacterized protein
LARALRTGTLEAMTTRDRMDELVDGHFRAEEAGDIPAILAGFNAGAEHDVVGRPRGPVHGGEEIAAYYRGLLAELEIDRFEVVRRRYGDDHVVDESILHATATGRVFGLDGGGRRVAVRLLHVFDFADGRIARENAWLDLAGLRQQLATAE